MIAKSTLLLLVTSSTHLALTHGYIVPLRQGTHMHSVGRRTAVIGVPGYSHSHSHPGTTLHLAKKGNIELPPNEFSRPLRTEAVLGPRRKLYNIEIAANTEELEALATRFSLSKITKLEADLVLKRDRNSSTSIPGAGGECIYVMGNIIAAVTQTCVRTNEDFDVDLEFEISSLVRSTCFRGGEDDFDLGGMSAAEIEGSLGNGNGGGGGARSNRKKGKKRRGGGKSNSRESGSLLDGMKMQELQDLLQEFDVEEDIVEDESIFGTNGFLDVGELIAQSFRLKLDPYPKKPGSEPVNYSITG